MPVRRKDDALETGGSCSAESARFSFAVLMDSLRVSVCFRRAGFFLAAVMVLAGTSLMGFGQHGHASAPPPPPQAHAAAPQHSSGSYSAGRPSSQPKPPGQQHLNEWLKQNQGLSSQQQMSRLQHEPGFSRLPPDQQQRLAQRLRQVNQMPPDQRKRVLERVENLEHLPPQQQQAVRSSANRLGQLPPNRQQAVKEAIRNLRDVPPAYRQSQLYSPRYASQLTPEEKGIVGNLLTVESYHPAAALPPQ